MTTTLNTQRADDRADGVRRVDAPDEPARVLARSDDGRDRQREARAPQERRRETPRRATACRSTWKVIHGLGDSVGLIGQ